jgi:mannan endo-1,4-beta-mannosidase
MRKYIAPLFIREAWIATIAFLLCLASCRKDVGGNLSGGSGGGAPVPSEPVPDLATARSWLVDKNATEQTAALFYHLKRVSKTNILFGHQDDTKRGVTNATTQWANEEHLSPVPRDKSDVKEVTGAYPALYGHDFIHIANFADGGWYDYEAKIARELTIDAYNRGGVNTYAWHYANPVSKGSFYWSDSPTEAVSKILPGGSHHDVYKQSLKEIADFAKSLIGADGKLVPIIFRPFHEFDGDWFWWGRSHTTAENYKALYQFTVTHLRDALGVRNFLYAWSPDRGFNSESALMERYPGDAYVDIVGMDNYWDLRSGTATSIAAAKLKIISDYAKQKNKVAALTETGLQNVTQANWYTQMLLKVLQEHRLELGYVMVWANTKDAYWTPYKGHPAEADFISFKNNNYLLLGDRLPKMYELK